MKKLDRVTLIVLDSAGVGEAPDAELFDDKGSNTFSHISTAAGGLNLPNMEKLGLGNLTDISGVLPLKETEGAYGKANEMSKGKDTTVGHWEIAGLIKDTPFPSYPNGFPQIVLDEIEKETGRGVLCNLPYSGTQVIDDYGDEHIKTGKWIVYTSADPVIQIAAHEDIVSIKELYKACEVALEICKKHAPVARSIARPFIGTTREFKRTSRRHDYAVVPDKETLLDRLKNSSRDVVAIGKISDIFAGVGITDSRGTNTNNKDGILKTIKAMKEDTKGLIFTNLVDFDMLYGHRRDPEGYKNALEEFDRYLPEIIESMKEKEILIITADHGCDPTFKGSDHTREYIPLLVYGKGINGVDLGIRESFSDIAATIEELILGTPDKKSFASLLYKE